MAKEFSWVEIENLARIYSCYSSPSWPIEGFNRILGGVVSSTTEVVYAL